MSTTAEELLNAAIGRVARVALDLFVADKHRWSTRHCSTCATISDLLGQPWGCSLYRITPENERSGGNYGR